VAYVAQVTDQTHVARLLGLSWRTVGRIIQRVVERRLDASRFHGLRRIGIDEFSYRKRHRYLTVVVDHDRKRVVWAGPGRSAEALAGFFSQLDQNTKDSISTVTMDMAGGYIKAVAEHLPNASIVFDRFHVQRLVADAIDGIRRECVTSLRGTGRESWVKGMRFILLRHGSELNLDDIDRIAHLGKTSKALQRAWLRKEELVAIFDETDPVLARTLLKRWLAWASRSRIPSFVRIGRTLRRHWNGIIAYFDERLTNGLVEGFNNKIRVVARTAYGFHSPDALIARIFLVVGGLSLQPELP